MGAIIETDKEGRRRLWFWLGGKRRSIRVGRMRDKDAEQLQEHVDAVLATRETGQALDGDSRRWLARLSDEMYGKIAAVGLVEPRRSAMLGEFLDNYVASRVQDTQDSTRLVYGHTRRCLMDFFGADRALASVTRGDAERWRRWLLTEQKLAENTTRRRVGIARQFFNQAIKDGLLDAGANPFTGQKVSLRREEDRFYYVTVEQARKVLDACPDAQWRALFALARWGGLRVPSEVL